MTIDEEIAYQREKAKEQRRRIGTLDKEYSERCEKWAEEHEQLAEWLEELKAYREIGTVEECKDCVLQILEAYNKGIDDFVEKILEKAPRNYVGDLELGGSVSFLSANAVAEIAEQLKVGENQ